MGVLRTKSIEQSIRDTEESEHRLKKDLSAMDLTVFGIGVIIGTGIFVLTGIAAATKAGPAVSLSFVLAGVACALAALCYAEFASTVPVAGSAYTFSYASLGELVAWIIGWDLVLEFALGSAAVAVGWAQYFASVFPIPESISGEGSVNLAAGAIVLLLTAVMILGVKLSSRFNAVMVAIKLAVVFLFIGAGAVKITASNWSPFIPPPAEAPKAANAVETGSPLIQVLFGIEPLSFGWLGIAFGAAIVFFAFIGFDVVATTAEETRNPQRDMPIGILGSLAICTLLYVVVSLVLTGMVKYTELNTAAPMADALKAVGYDWIASLVSLGALAGLTTVILILMMGQSRVVFAMSRDRLLPGRLAAIHPRYGTPWVISLVTGVVVALIATFVPLSTLADMVNIGTLFAFVLVSIGVLVLRRTQPELPRAFRTPAVPLVPILAVIACVFLMLNLGTLTWWRFLVWMALGFAVYFFYGYRNSRLAPTAWSRPSADDQRTRPAEPVGLGRVAGGQQAERQPAGVEAERARQRRPGGRRGWGDDRGHPEGVQAEDEGPDRAAGGQLVPGGGVPGRPAGPGRAQAAGEQDRRAGQERRDLAGRRRGGGEGGQAGGASRGGHGDGLEPAAAGQRHGPGGGRPPGRRPPRRSGRAGTRSGAARPPGTPAGPRPCRRSGTGLRRAGGPGRGRGRRPWGGGRRAAGPPGPATPCP